MLRKPHRHIHRRLLCFDRVLCRRLSVTLGVTGWLLSGVAVLLVRRSCLASSPCESTPTTSHRLACVVIPAAMSSGATPPGALSSVAAAAGFACSASSAARAPAGSEATTPRRQSTRITRAGRRASHTSCSALRSLRLFALLLVAHGRAERRLPPLVAQPMMTGLPAKREQFSSAKPVTQLHDQRGDVTITHIF